MHLFVALSSCSVRPQMLNFSYVWTLLGLELKVCGLGVGGLTRHNICFEILHIFTNITKPLTQM